MWSEWPLLHPLPLPLAFTHLSTQCCAISLAMNDLLRVVLLGLLFCTQLLTSYATPPVRRASDSDGPTVQLGNTSIVGVTFNYAGNVEQDFFGGMLGNVDIIPCSRWFSGLPFARPPLGDLRFAPPVFSPTIDSSTFDANEFGFPCPQLGVRLVSLILCVY